MMSINTSTKLQSYIFKVDTEQIIPYTIKQSKFKFALILD